ncbi:MAG: M28 family peptidase [Actinobacteria bacterium]|nr:M28 family peptidase [Actinomycetota bacterium]
MRRVPALTIILAATAVLMGTLLSCGGGSVFAGDGTCGEASAEGSTTWYFAEGYTGEGFQEYLTLLNPQDSWTELDLDLLYNEGSSQPVELDLPPQSRVTMDINAYAGQGKEVSLHLESTLPIVAERPMYFTYRGAWNGCTVTSVTEALSDAWYFAEGCTREGFETWVLLANPGEGQASATVHLILEDASVTPVDVDLPPHSRRTVFVNDMVGEERDVSARIEASIPICVERVMYFDYHGMWEGGHASSGLSLPRQDFLFAEGYTGAGFEEWLTLYSPRESGGDNGTDVTLNCLFQGVEEQSFDIHLEPDRRHTLNINQLVGEGKDVSMELSADEPFLAERPMYFNYKGVCRGGHVSKGIEAAGTHWYLAEGTTRPGYDTYLCLMNPGEVQADLEVDFVCAGGYDYSVEWAPPPPPKVVTHEYSLPPGSRLTLDVEQQQLMPAQDYSFEVRSDQPIAVERSLYYPGCSFNVDNAMDHLWNLSVNIGERVEGTEGELAAAYYLMGVLEGYGYEPWLQDVPLPNGSFTHNVIADRVGTWGDTMIVGGHYDTKIATGSPGANDNGSGAVVTLELARCFAEMPARCDLRFIFFGGEELLVNHTDLHHFGSRYYVDNMTQEEEEDLVGAVIIDMVGVGEQLYARTMGVGPMDLCNRLMAYSQGAGISLPYMLSGSYSDHEPFENAGIPAVWLEYKDDPWYHTFEDSYDKINPAFIENTGRLLEGFIRDYTPPCGAPYKPMD